MHAISNRPLTAEVQSFEIPNTQAEFDKLTFAQRITLYEQHQAVYKKFVTKQKTSNSFLSERDT